MMFRQAAVAATLLSLTTTVLSSCDRPTCTSRHFASLDLPGIHITSLNVTSAHSLSTSGRNATGGVGIVPDVPGVPAATVDVCLVQVTYTHPGQHDEVNAYIGLPFNRNDWNSRFVMDGGGGWSAGGFSTILSPLLDGYATSSTDGGHDNNALTAEWGLTKSGRTNWPALADFSSVAIAEAAKLGKLATELYYGKEPSYSYWHGCSTGGRQGHAMAQEYPELFDGIVGGAPAVSWDKFAPAGWWAPFMAQLLDTRPPTCVLDTFTAAATEACDELDGVKDGIIAYPGQCHFDAYSLVGQKVNCTDPAGEIKITKKMAKLVNAIWEGPRAKDGRFEWYGFHYDSSLTSMLGTTCTSVNDCTVIPFPIADDWVKVFLARDPTFTPEGLTRDDYDRLFHESIEQYSGIIGTSNPDLSKLKQVGTKLLAWHGMADQLVPTNGTVDYYTSATAVDPHVSDYYRLFLAPGVTHCGYGIGFDPSQTVFGAMRAWVENGTVPDRLEAVASAVGSSDPTVTRTGYLCPYPQVFTYNGGDPNADSSFICV